ncbi:MAG: alpha/beta hydrolase [Calditrichaeota bacterium]|nr:MAG: alpha/beta hydrolase [Calditrichota bacterium]
MKKYLFISVVLFSAFLFNPGCSFSAFVGNELLSVQNHMDNWHDDSVALYVSEEQSFPVSNIVAAFDSTVRYQPAGNAHILFVHGMGDYPSRAFFNRTFSIFPEKYNANVVLFKWPAWIDFHTMPVLNGIRSAPLLYQTLSAWSKDTTDAYPKILLTHSMGAVVLSSMLRHYNKTLPEGFIDALIIMAPEVDLKDHAKWLEKATFARRVYVLFHHNDPVLKPVEIHMNKARLGMRLTHLDGTKEPLARNAVYIDVSDATDWHAYHLFRQSDTLLSFLNAIIYNDELAFTSLEPVAAHIWRIPSSEEE